MTNKTLLLITALALLAVAGCAPKPHHNNSRDGHHNHHTTDPNKQLRNGPMLGYVDMREVLIWVQTTERAQVEIEYQEAGDTSAQKFYSSVETTGAPLFTAKCIANEVQPGKTYNYGVLIDGKAVKRPYPTTFKTQSLWQWRTDPPAFTLATGSCAYFNEEQYDRPGKPYGSDFQIFTSIEQQKPDLMLWLGDNVYLREPDFNTATGMIHRYTHDRATPELQPLLASTAHYAIWDDHDFGPNDSDGTSIYKDMAWDVFRNFWGNPTFGVNGKRGCTTRFQYADIDFFLLDNRYFRTPNYCKTCPDRTLLGKDQLEWFLASLASSTAPFKMVAIGGQVVTTNNSSETCFHFFPAERDTILARIEREGIKGVVFLTGDRHFSELSILRNKAGNAVYDLTTSPLTAGVYTDAAKEANSLRVEGTLVTQHNFSTLRFSGPRKARQMEITVRDINGKELWTRTVKSE